MTELSFAGKVSPENLPRRFKLRQAGVAVTARRYLGMIHGFASMPYVTAVANHALADVAADLRVALTA